MDNSLQVFSYNNNEVRTVEKDGEIWFVAKDVCDVLGLTNPTVALEALDDDERAKFFLGRSPVHGGGGEANIISESGLYSLVLRSNKPEAKNFSRWVRHDVLPAIRKTGNYSKGNILSPSLHDALDGAKFIFETAGIKENQLTLALDKVYKSYMGKSALDAGGVYLIAPVQKQLLTPTELAVHFNFPKPKAGARVINKLLENAGYQVRLANSMWEPSELGKPFAVLLDTNKKHSDGTPVRSLKWNSNIIRVLDDLLHDTEGEI